MNAKFRCAAVVPFEGGETLTFTAVYSADPNHENYTWSKWTPNGTLTLSVTNPALVGKYVIGKEYDLIVEPSGMVSDA